MNAQTMYDIIATSPVPIDHNPDKMRNLVSVLKNAYNGLIETRAEEVKQELIKQEKFDVLQKLKESDNVQRIQMFFDLDQKFRELYVTCMAIKQLSTTLFHE